MWSLIWMLLHLSAAIALVCLYRYAPCWMQRTVVTGLALTMFIFMGADVLTLAGGDDYHLYRVAYALEHLAVLLYVFRLMYQRGIEHGRHPKPSAAISGDH